MLEYLSLYPFIVKNPKIVIKLFQESSMLEYCTFHLTQHHLVLNAPDTVGVAHHHFCCCCEAAREDEDAGSCADPRCPKPCIASLEIRQ